MTRPALSTIAQLLYPHEQAFEFARIVAEIEEVLSGLRIGGSAAPPIEVHWDQDDLVYFDVLETRILLASVEYDRGAEATCLTLSVGPAGRQSREASHHAVLCSRLVEQIRGRFPPAAILWQEIAGPVDSDVIDDLFDTLPKLAPAPQPCRLGNIAQYHRAAVLPRLAAPDSLALQGQTLKPNLPPRSPRPALWRRPALLHSPVLQALMRLSPVPRPRVQPASSAARSTLQPKVVASSTPSLPCPRDPTLIGLRAALYPTDAAVTGGQSTQIRLAAHCLNATLVLVWMPLGAAVMTYSILKGEDIRLSSRLMAVVGAVVTLAHSPYGSAVKAMTGV